ncbi:MAG TPA: hypothetical protein VD971_13385 [Phycisphaerales bacterium]|nr:hypothetical protein [Phycisphaerales bacterium]
MTKSILRTVYVLLVLLAVGPLSASLLAGLRDADGGNGVTILTGGRVGAGLAGLAVLALGALVAGAAGAKLFSAGMGFAGAGLVFAWGAWNLGTLEEVLRRTRQGKESTALAAEGLLAVLVAGVVMGVAWIIAERAQGRDKNGAGGVGLIGVREKGSTGIAATALAAWALAACAAGVAAAIIAISAAKGQAVFAAFAGAIVAGIVAQTIGAAQHVKVSPLVPALAMAVPAVAGPLIAALVAQRGWVPATFAGSDFPLGRVVGLDWSAGVLLGVPVGMGWAGAMIDHRAPA